MNQTFRLNFKEKNYVYELKEISNEKFEKEINNVLVKPLNKNTNNIMSLFNYNSGVESVVQILKKNSGFLKPFTNDIAS